MLKNYELLYIIHPDLEGSSEKVTEKVAGFIKKVEGNITNQEEWGKKKLAYKVAKNDFGVYVLVNFSLESSSLPAVEHDLGLTEEVIRSMVIEVPVVKPSKKSRRTRAEARNVKKAEAEKAPAVEEAKKEKAEKPAEAEAVVEKKPRAKKAEVVEPKTEKSETPKKTAAAKTTKAAKEKTDKKAEAERMKKLDEKLDQILGE